MYVLALLPHESVRVSKFSDQSLSVEGYCSGCQLLVMSLYLVLHHFFPPKSNEAAVFPNAVNFTGNAPPLLEMCFLSILSLQLSCLDHAALIRQLIDC